MFAPISKFSSPLPLFLSLSLLEEGQNLEAGAVHDKEILFFEIWIPRTSLIIKSTNCIKSFD